MLNPAAGDTVALWPLALYFGLVLLTAAGFVVLSYVLGERHNEPFVFFVGRRLRDDGEADAIGTDRTRRDDEAALCQ